MFLKLGDYIAKPALGLSSREPLRQLGQLSRKIRPLSTMAQKPLAAKKLVQAWELYIA